MPRAHGFILDPIGNPVQGARLFFYRVAEGQKPNHYALIDKAGAPAGQPVYSTVATAEHRENLTIVSAQTITEPNKRGYFDVPDGLPVGSYWVHVHVSGQQRWAWPLVVGGGDEAPKRIRVGGPIAGVPGGAERVLVVFGDSDSSVQGPAGARDGTDIAREITVPGVKCINRAEGATPIHGYMQDGDDPRKRNGLEQVQRACREMPRIDIAVCRFGLNDCHLADMNPPTPLAIAEIRQKYEAVIDSLRAKGATQVILCAVIHEADKRADRSLANREFNATLRGIATAKSCTFIDPGIDANNDPQDYVWDKDGIHLNAHGTAFVADLIERAIPTSPIPGPGPSPSLDRQFTRGTFTPSISLYGLLAAPLDRAKRDLSRFRAAGFGNARVWIDWDYFGVTGARALDRDGNFVEPIARKLDELMLYGVTIGMSFDLTMHAAGYNAHPKGGEGYDIAEHKRAVKNTLSRWGLQSPFRILDMANEAEVRGQGGHGSPDTGHVSPGRFLELMTVARSVPRKCLVGVSISPGGDYDDVILNYKAICRDTKPEILLPHFGRKSGWGAKEGPQGAALAKAFPGLFVHHQEPARNGHSTQPGMWPVSEFEAAFKSTQAAGAVGCCLHTDAGFDMRERDAWDQLDAVERQVVDSLKGWIA